MAFLTNPQTIPAGGKPPWKKFLTRQKWKLRDTAKLKTPPARPATALQIGIRCAISYAFAVWWTLEAWEHATYPTRFCHSYLKAQMDRWAADHGPTRAYPGYNEVGPDAIADDAYAPSKGTVTCTIEPATATDLAAIIVFRSANEIVTPGHANAVKFIPATSTAVATWLDTPLPPGTYHYRAATLQDTGRIGPPSVDAEVTVP